MAQDIALLGALFSDVPSVELPKQDGGTASFVDISNTTAAASNVLKGKYFYTSAGVRTNGSMTNRGTVTATITEPNGVYTIPKGYHSGSGTVTATYSGYNVATGTYTGDSNTHSFTISGLGFKPSSVAIFNIISSASNASLILSASTIPVVNPSTGNNVYGVRRSSSSGSITNFSSNPFTANNDGFTCANSNGNFGGTYVYVAWG